MRAVIDQQTGSRFKIESDFEFNMQWNKTLSIGIDESLQSVRIRSLMQR